MDWWIDSQIDWQIDSWTDEGVQPQTTIDFAATAPHLTACCIASNAKTDFDFNDSPIATPAIIPFELDMRLKLSQTLCHEKEFAERLRSRKCNVENGEELVPWWC